MSAPVQAVTLVEDSLGTFVLHEDTGVIVTKIDVGHPSVRAVSTDRVGASGTYDDTRFHGARAVSLSTECFAPDDGSSSRRAVIDRVRAYTSPARRPVLQFTDDDGIARQIRLRGDDTSWPLEKAGEGARVPVLLSWVGYEGVLETVALSTATVSAVPAPLPGVTFPLRMPVAFPASTPYNTTVVRNSGTEPTPALMQLWGPCTSPVLTNVTTGQKVALPGLTLNADQYAEIDVANATILLNGRPAESLYSYQQWGVSQFWWLAPGVNLIRYEPAVFTSAAVARLAFRSRSL